MSFSKYIVFILCVAALYSKLTILPLSWSEDGKQHLLLEAEETTVQGVLVFGHAPSQQINIEFYLSLLYGVQEI